MNQCPIGSPGIGHKPGIVNTQTRIFKNDVGIVEIDRAPIFEPFFYAVVYLFEKSPYTHETTPVSDCITLSLKNDHVQRLKQFDCGMRLRTAV